MAPHLLIGLIGLLYVVFFGALSFMRREGISLRFTLEGLLITIVGAGLAAWLGSVVNPVFFIVLLYLITMRVRLLVDLGNLLARQHNHAAAARIYALARRAWPDDSGRLLVQLNEGVLALKSGQLEEAVTTFRQVLAAATSGYLGLKSQAAGHYNLGVAYQRQGLEAQATLEFNRVLDTLPVTEYARYARIALEKRRSKGQADKPETQPD